MKLYLVNDDGVLEVVTLVSDNSAASECSVPTFLVRHADGTEAQVSQDLYFTTAAEAWQEYVHHLREAISSAEKSISRLQDQLSYWREQLAKAETALGD